MLRSTSTPPNTNWKTIGKGGRTKEKKEQWKTVNKLASCKVMLRFTVCVSLLQMLADGVIPNEYGINPWQKLKIGSKVVYIVYDARCS